MATDGASCEPDLSRAPDDPAGATAEASVTEFPGLRERCRRRLGVVPWSALDTPRGMPSPSLECPLLPWGPISFSEVEAPEPFLLMKSLELKKEFDVDNLSKSELRMLLSVMEGELEARDLVIEALRFSDWKFRILTCFGMLVNFATWPIACGSTLFHYM
ncbi:hypothetical protein STEG23_034981, partial [Scotinomys teguina]